MNDLKDSGSKRVFESGAHRDNDEQKPRLDLLPMTALIRVSFHYAAGAKKYGENNWRRGIPRQEFLKSAFRHLAYLLLGATDEDHAAALAWNVLCFIETEDLNLDAPPEKKPPFDKSRCQCAVLGHRAPCSYCTGESYDSESV